jgi:translocation and assembly module TamB
MDLHATGTVELATLNPILAANGREVRGRVTLGAAIAGTPTAPRVAGTLRVADGDVQDFVLGAHLRDIEGVIQANGDSINVTSFTARAGKGTLSASGTVGVAAPMPVALTLTARNATPLASDRLTAVLNADLSVRGDALGRLEVAGAVRIAQADIRIPDKMPAQVAVLQVRRPGQKPPPAAAAGPVIGLAVTLSAPGRIFVRGRGLNAELAGDLHIGGTSVAPQPNGAFTLVRGQFSLAGTTLDFTQGKVGFDGSGRLDPTLDFLATSSNGTITANLAITGYASAPKITLSSTPQLPQDEVLSWLLFHQASGSLSPFQLVEIAQALAQISGVEGGAGPLDALRSRLGLDQLSLGTGANGTGTAVQAGRYVARGVYVGAKQSTSGNGTQATVQVDLAKGLKLEATAGTTQSATGASTTQQDQGTSVGLTYQFQY